MNHGKATEQLVSPGWNPVQGVARAVGICHAVVAEKTDWTKARLKELIRGKRGVTAEAALDLVEVLGNSPKLWINFQATYDRDKARDAAWLVVGTAP